MTKQHNTRQKLIAKIHIGKQELGMDDNTYRAMLMRVTGKNSCSKMNPPELAKVLDELARLGFGSSMPDIGMMPPCRTEVKPMMTKLAVLLRQTGKNWDYAHALARGMFKAEKVNHLNPDQLRRLLTAMQYHADRHNKQEVSA